MSLLLYSGIALAGPRVVVAGGQDVVGCWDGTAFRDGADCPLGEVQEAATWPLDQGGRVAVPLSTRKVTTFAELYDVHPCPQGRAVTAEVGGQTRGPVLGPIQPLDPSNQQYAGLVAEAAGLGSVKLTQLVKVDLEGDGRDEALFTAGTDEDAYSFVGLRALVGEEAKTIFLHSATWPADPSVYPPTWSRARLLGLTDLDGDAGLEIVLGVSYHEGYEYRVVRIRGAEASVVARAGCDAG